MYINKFITFGLSTLLECAGGASYAFSLYSPALKDSLHYTQVQVQAIANPLVPSLILGILPGIVYDYCQKHNRIGPRFILLIGGLVHLVGYVGLWAVGTHAISQPSYWVVVSLGVVAMNGASWTDVACVSACVRSFPMDRGTVIGILKSVMGLSASVFATIYAATLQPHSLSFILVIAAFLPLLCLLSFPFFNAVPFRQKGEISAASFWSNGVRFAITYGVIGLLSLLMLSVSFLDLSASRGGRIAVLAAMVAIVLPLALLPLGSGGYWAKPAFEDADTGQEPEDLEASTLLAGAQDGSDVLCGGLPDEAKESSRHKWPLEFTTEESLRQLNFWLLYFIFGIGSACGLLFLNNAGQLVESLGGLPDGQDPLLALFSVFNCLGRLLFGCLPEYSLHRWGTPRSMFLVVISVCMAAVTFLTALASIPLLYLTAPVAGLIYGAHWSLMPALASEYFGLSHFGLNYCLLVTSITVMSFCVSNLMGGYVYQARLEQHGDKNNVCMGSDCFGPTFLVAALLEVCIIVASYFLHKRTQYIYAQEQRKIKKEEALQIQRNPETGHRLVRQGLSDA